MKRKSALFFYGVLLLAITAGCAPKLFMASHRKDIEQIDSLLAGGADINSKYLGATVLAGAASTGDITMVKVLLQRGADPAIPMTSDPIRPRTPRQIAEDRGYAEVAKVLQEAEERKFGLSPSTVSTQNIPQRTAENTKQITLSVMDLIVTSGLAANEMVMLTDKLLNEIVAIGYYKVVERSNRDEILKEQGFQQSGACDQGTCLVEAGQLLGVQKIVGGTIGKLGSIYAVELRVMDVQSGEIDQGFSRQYSGDVAKLLGAMKEAASVFSDNKVGNAH